MDNYTDRLLPDSPVAKREPMVKNGEFQRSPLAEHGFSALIEVQLAEKKHKFLFDTGASKEGMLHNAEIFGVQHDFEAIILSHGHFDHFTGLASTLAKIGAPSRLVVHPDAFLKRWLLFPDGSRAKMPDMDEDELVGLGAVIEKKTGVTALPSEENPCMLVTGEIPHRTSYEIGFPLQHAETDQGLVHDPLVKDDQALVVNLRDKGIVVVSGCGHAGIINTIQYAKEIAGTEKVHAVAGGFHLTGPMYEGAIEPTLQAIKVIDPCFIVPCHCTGWKAVNRIIQNFPEKFIQPSVGTTLNFYTK